MEATVAIGGGVHVECWFNSEYLSPYNYGVP